MLDMKINKTAKKLLEGDTPDFLWGDMGIKESEHDFISHERIMQFVKSYPVINVSVSHNNYGKFMFISLQVNRECLNGNKWVECLQFWGNGYHEKRGVMLVDWCINVGNGFMVENKESINKKLAIAQINDYRLSLGIKSGAKQTKSHNKFEFIADLTDDDFASIYTE